MIGTSRPDRSARAAVRHPRVRAGAADREHRIARHRTVRAAHRDADAGLHVQAAQPHQAAVAERPRLGLQPQLQVVGRDVLRQQPAQRIAEQQRMDAGGAAELLELPLALARAHRKELRRTVHDLRVVAEHPSVGMPDADGQHVQLHADPPRRLPAEVLYVPRKLSEAAQRHDVPDRGIGLRGLAHLSHQQARRPFGRQRQVALLHGAAQIEQVSLLYDQNKIHGRIRAGKLALHRKHPAIDLAGGNARHAAALARLDGDKHDEDVTVLRLSAQMC